jgi:hypothetical protein
MSSNWAEENLQVIRTLMERSALYRRAMAPMMLVAGTLGLVGGLVGHFQKLVNLSSFLQLWCVVAAVGLLLAARLIRSQAMKSEEPFWTPPAKRIFQAVLPAFIVGGGATAPFVFPQLIAVNPPPALAFVAGWLVLYGFGIHSAGFAIAKGIKRLGWIFLLTGLAIIINEFTKRALFGELNPHLLMAATFGGFHLVCWIYLLFTEKKDEPA